MRRLAVVLFVQAGLFSGLSHAQQVLIFSAMAPDPIGLNVLKNAYQQLGVEVAAKKYPGIRSLVIANEGVQVDGEVMRKAGITQQYPNLIQVPVPVFEAKMVAFTRPDRELVIENWDALKRYRVGGRRGIASIENRLKGFDSVTWVDEQKQIYQMLKYGRIDVAVLPEMVAKTVAIRTGVAIKILSPALEVVPLYHYLHKRHAAVVPQLTETLREMERTGSIELLTQRHETSMLEKARAGAHLQ